MTTKKLSPELIRRLIRVEQIVSLHFNKPLTYQQTEYFKSLTNEEKACFEDYLKKKSIDKKRKFLLPSILAIILLLILALNLSVTGRAIENSLHLNSTAVTGAFVLILFIVFAYLFSTYMEKKSAEEKFEYHLQPLERALKKQTLKT